MPRNDSGPDIETRCEAKDEPAIQPNRPCSTEGYPSGLIAPEFLRSHVGIRTTLLAAAAAFLIIAAALAVYTVSVLQNFGDEMQRLATEKLSIIAQMQEFEADLEDLSIPSQALSKSRSGEECGYWAKELGVRLAKLRTELLGLALKLESLADGASRAKAQQLGERLDRFEERARELEGASKLHIQFIELRTTRYREITEAYVHYFGTAANVERQMRALVSRSLAIDIPDSRDASELQARLDAFLEREMSWLGTAQDLNTDGRELLSIAEQALPEMEPSRIGALQDKASIIAQRLKLYHRLPDTEAVQALGISSEALTRLLIGPRGLLEVRKSELAREVDVATALEAVVSMTEGNRREASELGNSLHRHIIASVENTQQELHTARKVYLVSVAFAVFSCFVIWRFLSRNLVSRIERLTESMAEAAADLSKGQTVVFDEQIRGAVRGNAHDEIASMGEALLTFIDCIAQRERDKSEAQQASLAKTEFLASMSHELRTPLNGILGYVQLLKRDPATPRDQRSRLNIVEQSANHLLMLVNDSLDLQKVEAGKIEIYPVDFSLPVLLIGVGELIRMRAELRGISFCLDLSPDLPEYVRGDEGRLRQILLNLLGNAVKFTEKGSNSLRAMPRDGKVCFEIEDTGFGIATEDLEIIFDPFQQAGKQEYRSQGTGLGLTISRNLIRAMGGELEVNSALGQGSKFWFEIELPVVTIESLPAVGERSLVVGVQGEAPLVLVVDDNQDNRSLFVEMLTSVGIRIIEARDGNEGLEKTLEFHPQAVITDLLMPDMNGFELIRHIKESPDLEDVKIIACSASVYEGDYRKSFDAGSDSFLPKPVQLDSLLAELQRHLKLEWRYRGDGTARAAEFILPPMDQLQMLHEISNLGDIEELQTQLVKLSRSDEQIRPFCDELLDLAERFEINALHSRLKEYIDHGS